MISFCYANLPPTDDSKVLTPLVKRLTGAATLPILLVAGQHQGDFDDIIGLHHKGDLRQRLIAAGAKLYPQVKKGRR